jgi:ubiquinone biosynthesis monooxygenase Coq7
MSEQTEQSRLIRRILRVNHAGEHEAVFIYGAQLKAASRYPEFKDWIAETLGHEIVHRAAFLAAMPSRAAKPCRALVVWSVGGRVLGWITACFGRTGLMACTAAVERTVHRHLSEQIAHLAGRDDELSELIRAIRIEEDDHLAFAESNGRHDTAFARSLSAVVSAATDLLIWISTRDDSMRLSAAMRNATMP